MPELKCDVCGSGMSHIARVGRCDRFYCVLCGTGADLWDAGPKWYVPKTVSVLRKLYGELETEARECQMTPPKESAYWEAGRLLGKIKEPKPEGGNG